LAEATENVQIYGGAGAVFAGDTAPEGDALTVTQVASDQGIVTPGTPLLSDHGTLDLNADGSYVYTANQTFAVALAPAGPLPDSFVFNISDENGGTATESFNIAIDRPPELANSTAVTYHYSVGPVAIDPGISLNDPDGDQITGATIDIGSGLLAGDNLNFSAQNGITGAYNQADGVLPLAGEASSDDYQAALQSIEFLSTAGDPKLGGTDTSRSINITVNEQSTSGMTIGSNNFETQIPIAICYVAGTRIRTDGGEVEVEKLQVGDTLLTASGVHRSVRWLGLRSRTFNPAHIDPNSTDTRNTIGFCVLRLQIDGDVALDDEAQFRRGWSGLEHENGRQHRWSRDRMPLPAGTRLVVIDLQHQDPVYWREPAVPVVAEDKSARYAPRLFTGVACIGTW
jgi:VCBS repeat-containing protein